jgi:hypothetical protein
MLIIAKIQETIIYFQLKNLKEQVNTSTYTTNPIKSGRFYSIYDASDHLVMEDNTKRGLEVRNRSFDKKYGAECDNGIIYDGGGTGHEVGIRWYFPKSTFALDEIVRIAEKIDERYLAIREMTCPDD